MPATKIATCCYCGTKAVLKLRGTTQHELTCATCGAPLRALKMLPKSRSADKAAAKPEPKIEHRQQAKKSEKPYKSRKSRRPKKRFGRKAVAGFWDLLEDVVDEIFD